MRKSIAALAVTACLMACQQGTKTDDGTNSDTTSMEHAMVATDTLNYQYDSIKAYSKVKMSSKIGIKDTTKITIVYPKFNDEKLNELVQNQVLINDNPDKPAYKNYQEVATDFIKNYDDFLKTMPEYTQAWFKEVDISVMPQRKNYLGLKYIFATYMGGAHPNSAIIYKNYNSLTLKELILADFVKPEEHAKLTAIAEQIFRKNEKISAKESLENRYFFENGVFVLNDNFTVTADGLLFLYNAYEIKPYVDGTTELFIPFIAIKDLLIANAAKM